jgi:hypothetical protein
LISTLIRSWVCTRCATGEELSILEGLPVLVNKPLADFIIDCNLILEALSGPSKRRGDPTGVVVPRMEVDALC